MEFEVTDSGAIRTLARVFQGASKVGDDLMIGNGADTVQMRTLNNTHSTCAMFVFKREFFDRLKLPRTQVDIKLPSRALLPIFRLSNTIQSLKLKATDTTLTVHTLSRSRLQKTYHVPILEGRLGVTTFSRASCSNALNVPSKFWQEILANFSSKLDEITLTLTKTKVKISSFIDIDPNSTLRMLRTEMELNIDEFEHYKFSKAFDVSLTIFCKYFRSLLEFSDHFDVPLKMYYEVSGMPLLFELDFTTNDFIAQYVFATRHIDNDMQNCSNDASATPNSSRRRSRPLKIAQQQPPVQSSSQLESSQLQTSQHVDNSQPQPPLRSRNTRERVIPSSGALARNSHVSETPENEQQENEAVVTPIQQTKIRRRIFHDSQTSQDAKSAGDEDKHMLDDSIPETPLSQPHKKRSSYADLGDTDESSHDSDDEFVEGTPPPSPG